MNDIQEKILDIFSNVTDICTKYNIRYFAIGGSCLGAVRHKGFIPWDDDIDIAVPIEEFERFKAIAKRELPSYLQIYTCDKVEHYSNIFIKIIDTRTTFIESSEYEFSDAYKGIFVDIMPISGVPNPGLERNIFYQKLKIYSSLNNKRRFQNRKAEGKIGYIISIMMRPFRKIIPYNYFSNKWYKLLKNNSFDSSNYVGYVWSKNVRKLTFPKSFFSEIEYLSFENTFIICPKMWHEYLYQQFGDYMKLPPEEERFTVHNGIIDLKKSYIDYQTDVTLIFQHK